MEKRWVQVGVEISPLKQRVLKWLFKSQYEEFKKVLDEELRVAFDQGYADTCRIARSTKEDFMQKKLFDLGFEVNHNGLQANENLDTTEVYNPKTRWIIVNKT